MFYYHFVLYYRIRVIAIRAFYFPKWLFWAHSIWILSKFAYSIQENCPKRGLFTQKCALNSNFNKVRSQFKMRSVMTRIRYVKPEKPICLRLRYDRIFFEEIIKFKSISRTLLQNVLLFVLFFCPLYVDSGLDYKIIHSFGVVKGKSKSTSTFEYYHSTPKYFCT